MIDPATVPYAKRGFNQGLIGSLVLIVLNLLFSVTGLVNPGETNAMTWVSTLLTWGVVAYFIYAAATKHRDEDLGGYISFGRAFAVGFMAVLAMSLVTAVWTWIYMAFIDPSIFDTIRQASMDQMVNKQGMSEEEAERALSMMSFMWTPPMMAAMVTITTLITGVIIDLIVSAVVKRDNPAFA